MEAMPRVTHIWVSPAKRQLMESRDSVTAVAGHGLEGCAHARPGTKREVLFVSADHLDAVDVPPGAVKENFTVAGADVQQWAIGQRVQVGDAVFEVAMVCDPCEQMEKVRPGLQEELEGRRGMLARVIEGGGVAAGDELTLVD